MRGHRVADLPRHPHQMVWAVPAVTWMALSPDRPGWGRTAAASATVLFWAAPIWWVSNQGNSVLHEHGWQLIAGNSFLLGAVLFVVASAGSELRRTRSVAMSRVHSHLQRSGHSQRGASRSPHGPDRRLSAVVGSTMAERSGLPSSSRGLGDRRRSGAPEEGWEVSFERRDLHPPRAPLRRDALLLRASLPLSEKRRRPA